MAGLQAPFPLGALSPARVSGGLPPYLSTMREHSWTGAMPALYDLFMAPLEAGPVGRWRERLWSGVPGAGLGLEVGTGTGVNLPLHPAGATVVASELSPRLSRRARRRHPTARARLLAADACALPFRSDAFDWVVATFVFCEVEDPARAFAELRRVMRPGGTLHMLEHVRPGGAWGHAAAALSRVTAPLLGEHLDRRTAQHATDAGFRIQSVEWLLRSAVVLFRAT